IAIYEQVLKHHPNQPKAWMSYGHTLKTAGLQDKSIAAYRKSIAQSPNLGEAYWSLANLKTYRFPASEIEDMRTQLARGDLKDEDRYHLHFALGKAWEDLTKYAESFEHYEKGNAVRRQSLSYTAEETTEQVRHAKTVFTRVFFSERAGFGSQ